EPLHCSLFLHCCDLSYVIPVVPRPSLIRRKVCEQTLNPIIACLSWSVPHVVPAAFGNHFDFRAGDTRSELASQDVKAHPETLNPRNAASADQRRDTL